MASSESLQIGIDEKIRAALALQQSNGDLLQRARIAEVARDRACAEIERLKAFASDLHTSGIAILQIGFAMTAKEGE